ncbi:MAG TPA: altronate dehydratase family protein [Aestuariivirgaceae bacterium]|nr:altronate dehydratase family protein [Aestuariivirgaceae bacterium]
MTTIIRLQPDDNVAVARLALAPGAPLFDGLAAREPIPAGHKVALGDIAAGEPVRKYGQIIGFASTAIPAGAHVHVDNVEMRDFERDTAVGSEARPTAFFNDVERASFQGYRRANGSAGTRNYIAVLTSVNCSATVARHIADTFDPELLAQYSNIDGIAAFAHSTGCGMAGAGDGYDNLQRVLWGYARHPNVGGVLMVGLGCEVNQIDFLLEAYGIERGPRFQTFNIQDAGGTRASIARGQDILRQMLPAVNDVKREAIPASEIVLALQCGGSDAYSGITANPALGHAADLLVRHGGTAILAETPEIYGAEHLLTRRAASAEVAEKLMARIAWWEDYTARAGGEMNNNPSPGNKRGGLTTILEKSLGAAAKGGTTNLVDVLRYGEPVRKRGFVFMDSPGYDPCSITGQVASGSNVVVFTTGRGSVYGCKPSPSIKLATNTATYERMTEDMDINCGDVLDGGVSIEHKGEEIFQAVLRAASGEPTKSEALGMGDNEFVPWQIGAVM